MEGKLAEIEENLRKITLEIGTLQSENEVLKQHNAGSREDTAPSHNKQAEAKSQSIGKPIFYDDEKKRMHHDLRSLMDNYEEMANRIGVSSSI